MNVPLLPGRIEHWPLARLKPNPRNAKTHDADQVARIAASMAKFGWTRFIATPLCCAGTK